MKKTLCALLIGLSSMGCYQVNNYDYEFEVKTQDYSVGVAIGRLYISLWYQDFNNQNDKYIGVGSNW